MALMVTYASLMEIQFEVTSAMYVGLPFDRIRQVIRKALPEHLCELASQRALDVLGKQQACPQCAGKRVFNQKICGACRTCSKCRGSGWIILDLKGNTETCVECEGTGFDPCD